VKVLLADDDRVLTHLLSVRLRAKGCKITVAHDAMQVLMAAMRDQPDAIVLDHQMPGGTGLEALRKLKVSAKTSHIPVLVLSATTDPAVQEQVRSIGADEFLAKPVEPDALYERLQVITGRPA
jgi:DNA-binding response OmpR family regulator